MTRPTFPSPPLPVGKERVEVAWKSTKSVSLKTESRYPQPVKLLGGGARLVISRFAGLLDTRFPRSARARKGLSDYRGNKKGGRHPLLRSSLDTRENDGSVSWPADKCSENGPLFARWTTGNRRSHAVFARTLTEFHCNWGALENSYF